LENRQIRKRNMSLPFLLNSELAPYSTKLSPVRWALPARTGKASSMVSFSAHPTVFEKGARCQLNLPLLNYLGGFGTLNPYF
jgi:hypothetical protein